MLSLEVTRLLEPPPAISSRQWLEDNVVMPEGTETAGLPFSLADFPHVAGVCDAFDRPDVRRISLQWGTRLGKTTTCLSLMARVAGTRPRNMMICSTTKDSVGRVVSSRLYPILRKCGVTSGNLPALGHQGKFHVDLKTCRIYVGWSGSDSSLADVGAWYVLCNEVDKWEADKSDEADPLDLAINRAKGFVDHKILLESTPTIKGRSRIERAVLGSKRHDRYVPCPHCGEFQILIAGTEESPGGIKWERSSSGKSDPDTAFTTAYYRCAHCGKRIEDYHRVPMLRKGVWCPEGCDVNVYGEIVGTAYKEGSDRWGFGPLPSWYSCIERWGNFARQWVSAKGNKRQLQDVFNSYMAQTFEEVKRKETWETLGERSIAKDLPPRIVPEWASLLTIGVDRQADRLPWVVEAWGPGQRCHTVAYGEANDFDHLYETAIKDGYVHQDGGSLPIAFGLFDSGYLPKGVGEFCAQMQRKGIGIYPSKGSNTALTSDYSVHTLGAHTAMPNQKLFMVDTMRTQLWLESQLAGGDPPYSLHAGPLADHQDFLTQLLNDAAVDGLDKNNNVKQSWERVDTSVPNDFRDCRRYAYVAMLARTRGGKVPQRVRNPQPAAKPTKPQASAVDALLSQRQGGWV